MPSLSITRRSPLLILVILIIVVLILRAFLPNATSGFEATPNSQSQIRMLTYNIWNSPKNIPQRMEALGEVVKELQPDVMSFQEVTLDNLAVLKQQKWFTRYHLIPPDVTELAQNREHFVVILSRYPVQKWFIHKFKHNISNRTLNVAETNSAVSSNVRFVIAGTHLAWKREDTRLRELQLQEAFKRLAAYENVCVMGDLNIKYFVDVVLPPSWIDAWLSFTGNTDGNGITMYRSKSRLDRVLCKLSDFKVKEIRIVGDKLSKSGIRPSDHFGLFTVIERVSRNGVKRQGNQPKTEREVYFEKRQVEIN